MNSKIGPYYLYIHLPNKTLFLISMNFNHSNQISHLFTARYIYSNVSIFLLRDILDVKTLLFL